MRKSRKPAWAVAVPQEPIRRYDRLTERSVLRSIKREADGRWNGKGDPKRKLQPTT